MAYSTKYSSDEITKALKDIIDTEAFNIVMFEMLYGDMDELINSSDSTEKLEARKLFNNRFYELIDKYGEPK
jgi:hypothetical protein